jgi:hypothetical protein
MNQPFIQIILEFRHDLLSHFDVATWNAFINDLMAKNLIPPIYTPGEKPEPLSVLLDFRGLKRSNYRLDGINLSLCWLQDADFTGASLRNARLGCGRNVSYKGSRLHEADFRHVEISGCNFTDALGLESALFDGASYDPANPSIGLPPEILAKCTPDAEPPPVDRRKPSNPMEQCFRQAPIKCFATINLIPSDLTALPVPSGE